MILKFTTKRDKSGNRYTILINDNFREFKTDYNTTHDYSDYIEISKKDREKLINKLLLVGYKEV